MTAADPSGTISRPEKWECPSTAPALPGNTGTPGEASGVPAACCPFSLPSAWCGCCFKSLSCVVPRPLRTWCFKRPLGSETSLPLFLRLCQKMKKNKSPSPPLRWSGLSTCAPTRGAITNGRSTAALGARDSAPLVLRNPLGWALLGSRVLSQ